MFFILCLFAYILMSQSTLVDLKNPDQKKKGCWSGWSSYQIYCWSGREKWECLGLASGVLAVRHSTFALCLMAVLTQGCSSCKCCFPYCKIQRSTPVHLLCVFVFDLLFGFVFFPCPFGEFWFFLLRLQQKSWDKWNIFIREERNIPSRRESLCCLDLR